MSLAVLALGLLCASPASAQGGYPGGGYPGGSGYPGGYPGSSGGWVPSDSSGTPLQSVNSDGGANLLPTLGHRPKMTNTYPIPDSEDNWWFSVFSPNTHTTANPYYYYNSLHLDGHAGNSILDTSRYGHAVGTYAPNPWDPGEWMGGQTMPPDLNGKVHADNSDTLVAYFVWTGDQAHIPPSQDFLLNTSVSATASAYFGTGGATSGLSATATGTLEADTVTAQAGDAGSASPPPLTKRVLVHATPNGNLITLSRSASVSMDVSDYLPFSKWSDGEAQGGTSYYPYTGNLNGETSASASADVSAKAVTDSREMMITCPDIEDSNASGPTPDVRDPSGAITVDSAVAWDADNGGSNSGWESHVWFYATEAGFVNPLWLPWNKSGDGTLLSIDGVVQTNSYYGDWNFGTGFGNALNKSTTLTDTVEDNPQGNPYNGTPAGDGATATNTYTVRWHYPYENWQRDGAAFNNPPVPYPAKDGPQAAGGQVHIPISAAKSDWSVAGKIASGIVLTGAAAFPETDPIILGFAAATGATLASADPPPPPTEYTQSGTLQQFQSDVSTELSIVSGNTGGVFLPAQPRMDPKLATQVSNSGNYSGYFSGAAQGALSFNATAYRVQWQQNYSGDAYGVKGYTGKAASYIKWEGNWDYVFNWIWTSSGTPGPTG